MSVEYDCILWGYRTVVPRKFKKSVLAELHRSHMGIVKTKGLARSYVWWPKIDTDIEKIVGSCQELSSSPEKCTLIQRQPTQSGWSRVHVDYAGPVNNYYLLVVIDSFTKWVEAVKTKEITSSFTTKAIREIFWRYGLVDTLDNKERSGPSHIHCVHS